MRTTYTYDFNDTLNPITSYNQNSANTGSMIFKYTDLSGVNYVQPMKNTPYYIYLQQGTLQQNYPYVVQWSNDIDYIFTVYAAGAQSVLLIGLTKYQRSTNTFTALGRIQMTPSLAAGTNKQLTSVRAYIHRHNSGTVGVSGTAVTGLGTTFQSSRIATGARIGFGTTDATQVTTWYEISTITNDGSITLSTSAGTIPAGTSYVIEELRVFCTHLRSATFNAAGLIVVKGLHEGVFGSPTIIPESTTIDNIRAFYKLDPGLSEIQYPNGLVIDDPVSDTEQYCYVYNRPSGSTTNIEFFKYNVRAALTLTSGVTNNAFTLRTASVVLVGTQLLSSVRIATTNHGPASGVKSIYLLTSSRIYACPLSLITAGSTSFLAYAHLQTPPGTTNTFGVSTYGYFDYAGSIDTFITANSAAPLQMNLEKFGEVSTRYFYPNIGRVRNPSTAADAGEFYTNSGSLTNIWAENGILYSIVGVTTNNYIYAIPINVDSDYAINTNQFITTPVINTPGCTGFYSVTLDMDQFSGSDVLGSVADNVRPYVRTTGISGNTGTWLRVPDNGDISTLVGGANEIQVAITWQTMGMLGAYPWVYSVNVTYEDGSQDSHYLPSLANSSASSRIFAFYQAQLWNSNIPDLRIRLYNATTGFLILDDDVTTSLYGTWEYSSNGGVSWNPWNSSQDVVGNYIRYTASSLPANTLIRALLTIS